MQFLLDYADTDRVRDLIDGAWKITGVQGVVVDADPFWLQWLALVDYAGRERAERLAEGLLRAFMPDTPLNYRQAIFRRHAEAFAFPPYATPSRPLTLKDIHDHPPQWDNYSRIMQWPEEASDPVVIKICIRPDAPAESRERLAGRPPNVRLVVETRPQAMFQASPCAYTRPLLGGLSIGVGTTQHGTAGGIVTDGSTSYAVTCAHVVLKDRDVVDQPAHADDHRAAARIGERVAGTPLVACKLSDPCNRYTTTTRMNDLDVALVQIDRKTSCLREVRRIGPMTGIVARQFLNPGQAVDFSGKTSGRKRLLLGGVGVSYRIEDSAHNFYCMRDLVELRSSSGRQPTRYGDSGAWVCSPQGGGYAWSAMVVGGDTSHGYAIFASDIQQWWQKQQRLLTV